VQFLESADEPGERDAIEVTEERDRSQDREGRGPVGLYF